MAGTNRWGLWITSISAILNNPILGDGNLLFRPHNEYLQLAEHHGLPTLIFYLTALIILLVKAIKHFRQLSKTSILLMMTIGVNLISAIFGNIMPQTEPFFMIILGFTIRLVNMDIKQYKTDTDQKDTTTQTIENTENNF